MCVVKLKVLKPFRDKLDHKTSYPTGSTLETSDPARINDLVKRELAEVVAVEAKHVDGNGGESDGSDGGKTTDNPNHNTIAFKGEEFDVQTVKNALIAIGVAVAPNAGVKGLTAKVEALTEEQANALAEKLSEKEGE